MKFSLLVPQILHKRSVIAWCLEKLHWIDDLWLKLEILRHQNRKSQQLHRTFHRNSASMERNSPRACRNSALPKTKNARNHNPDSYKITIAAIASNARKFPCLESQQSCCTSTSHQIAASHFTIRLFIWKISHVQIDMDKLDNMSHDVTCLYFYDVFFSMHSWFPNKEHRAMSKMESVVASHSNLENRQHLRSRLFSGCSRFHEATGFHTQRCCETKEERCNP